MATKNKVRIIGGIWRGRIITFSENTELRPTHDRIRETLFNWLTPYLHHANCLDLFAGSGVLSFEALSRGAKHVTVVDYSKKIIQDIKKNAALLNTDQITFIAGEIPHKISPLQQAPFNIIFLDPPYRKNLIKIASEWLEINNYLAPNCYIYIEVEKAVEILPIPSHWEIIREKKTASLNYFLVRRCS